MSAAEVLTLNVRLAGVGVPAREQRDCLSLVGLAERAGDRVGGFSKGMQQRLGLAVALVARPELVVLDEPTSALDVVVQWQVIDTLRAVQQELGAAVIQIGHDMGLMAHSVDRVGVMYAGKLVELATVGDLFAEPLHPYTKMLSTSLPSLTTKHQLVGIPGSPPSPAHSGVTVETPTSDASCRR